MVKTYAMKKRFGITLILVAAAVFFGVSSCDDGANEFGRIDQKDSSIPVPSPVRVTEVRGISGGAVIKVEIPDDDNIKGVIARYNRGGKVVTTKISRYVDSLVLVGFADTGEHTAEVASFNVNEVTSSPTAVKFTPLEPAIRLAKPTLIQAFGGVKIRITGNTPKADLTICLLRDKDLGDKDKDVSEMKWEEVTTLFTAAETITLARRGLDPVEAIYGVYLRDRWGNVSDTVSMVITPLEETMLDKSKFTNAAVPDDNCKGISTYPITRLWDGSGSSAYDASYGYHFFASTDGPIPGWLTIDLGVKARLSRIATLPRIDYLIWSGAHPREFEFWGSMNPSGEYVEGNEHGFDDSWFCLGKFEQFKPSGYEADGSVGTVTPDDAQYFNAGNDFELDNEQYPHAYDELRYLRIVFANTFSTYDLGLTTGSVQFGEVTPYGQVQEVYR